MVEWLLGPGVISLILQIGCIVHVIRTDRSLWWILGLLLFPWLGVLAYVLFEVLPEWRGQGRPGRSVPFGSSAGSGNESIRSLKKLVEATPTVENRSRLANAYLRKGESQQAVEIYEACLDGLYADDKTLWYEIAEAYHADGQAELALQYLNRLEESGFRDYRERRALLTALNLEKLGQRAEALQRLSATLPTFPGQEARYHYARMLMAEGQEEAGRKVVEEMFKRRSSHDARYRRRERQWYAAARSLIA